MFSRRIGLFLPYNNTAKAKDMAAKLKDTFKLPKMCASASVNLTKDATLGYVEYYRGQNKMPFVIGEESNAA